MTDDHIPKIYRFGKNAYSIFGYSGRGIGPGTYFGKSIAEAFANENEDSLPLKPLVTIIRSFAQLKAVLLSLELNKPSGLMPEIICPCQRL